MFSTIILLVVSCLVLSNGYPMEEPTKFYLNTGNLKLETTQAPTKLEQAQSVAANGVAMVVNAKAGLIDQGRRSLESLQNLQGTFESFKPQQTVRLGSEAGQSLVEKTVVSPFTEFFIKFFMPTPLVDRIKEEEKYGNSGDKFIGIGKALVNGYESLSNFLNSAIEVSWIHDYFSFFFLINIFWNTQISSSFFFFFFFLLFSIFLYFVKINFFFIIIVIVRVDSHCLRNRDVRSSVGLI